MSETDDKIPKLNKQVRRLIDKYSRESYRTLRRDVTKVNKTNQLILSRLLQITVNEERIKSYCKKIDELTECIERRKEWDYTEGRSE